MRLIFGLFFIFVLACLHAALLLQFPFLSSTVQSCTTSSHQPANAICTGCSLQFAPPTTAVSGSVETCCVCQSSTNFEGRKLITGNGSILHRVTMKKGERLFLRPPIAQERLPSCSRRAVILPADTSVPLLPTTPKHVF